jgi:serine protease AprX
MTMLRSRLVALTAAAAAGLTGLGAIPAPAGSAPAAAPTAADRPGLSRLIATGTPTGRAIATFDSVPTSGDVAALRALGLTVQPMKALPLALLKGSVTQLRAAVTGGTAEDVYPDETLEYTDTASSDVMSSSPAAARALRSRGLTGKGVKVGVIDSGCDATHPDLAGRVQENVTLLSPEYANLPADETNTLIVPANEGPYSNTDLGSGHGTHVAGIIAADGSSGKDFLGVAPQSKLACFGIGAVITTTAVVTGFDYILRQPGNLGIDVINNSWGNSFRQFDPNDPVNIATRQATREDITVVFAAGNSGSGEAEASVSPFNQAPWVISVAAGTLQRKRGDFSSNGLRFDNSEAVPVATGGHTVARGDRIGLVHPDITAPGVDISSSCDSTGTVIGPCPQHGNTEASGTSMAAPHIAGAAAVLLQAQPRLTPAQVRQALFSTTSAVRGADGAALPLWQVGHGHVNLDRAVRLVRGDGWRTDLRAAWSRAQRRALASDGWTAIRGDMWQYAAPRVSVGGSDSRTYRLPVNDRTRLVYVTLVYPTPGTAANLAQYSATVFGPGGKRLGVTKTDLTYSHGTATLRLPVSRGGTYRIEVSGDHAVSDPDTLDSDSVNGRVVFLDAVQLRRS